MSTSISNSTNKSPKGNSFISPSNPSNTARSDLVPGVTNEQVHQILEYETIPPLAEFYKKVGWDPTKELQILIDIIRDEDNRSETRLRALKELQLRRTEILEACGLKVRATKVHKDKAGATSVCQADIVMAAMGFGVPGDMAPDSLKGVVYEKETREEGKPEIREGAEGDIGEPEDTRGTTGSPDSTQKREAHENIRERIGERLRKARNQGVDEGVQHKPPKSKGGRPRGSKDKQPRKPGGGRPKGTKDSPKSPRGIIGRRRRNNERRRRRRRERDEQQRESASEKVKSVQQ